MKDRHSPSPNEQNTLRHTEICSKELDKFVNIMLVDDSPPSLSLGTLCEELEYSYSWKPREYPQLTIDEVTVECRSAFLYHLNAVTQQQRRQIHGVRGDSQHEVRRKERRRPKVCKPDFYTP